MKKIFAIILASLMLVLFAVAANAAMGTVVYAQKTDAAPNLNEVDASWGEPAITINSQSPNTELFHYWTPTNLAITQTPGGEYSRYVQSGNAFEPEDYDVELYYLWDDKNLYFALKTQDDVFCGTTVGWEGDGVQMWIQPLDAVQGATEGRQKKTYNLTAGEPEGGLYYNLNSATCDFYWTLDMDDYSVTTQSRSSFNAASECDVHINTDTEGVLQCTIAIPLTNIGLNPKKMDLNGVELATAVLRISSVGTFESHAYAGWLVWGKYFDDTKVETLNTIVLTSEGASAQPQDTTPEDSQPQPAADLSGVSDWAKTEVEAAINEGLVPEYIQKNWTSPITRGQVSEMFIRLLEKATGKTVDAIIAEKGATIEEGKFEDTNDANVYAANALGIINGTSSSKFSPDGTLKRAQIAALINRVAKVVGVETEGYTHHFEDITDNYSWVDTELGWPSTVGIINGVSSTRFNPGGDLTTEQAILITYRALGALK